MMNQLERINRNLWGGMMRDLVQPEYNVWSFLDGMSTDRFKLDIKDSNDRYTITAELPGVNKEDIKVEVEGDRVKISAESQKMKEVKNDEKIVRSERYYGWLSRTVQLDQPVKSKGSTAKCENGILTLTLPKEENHRGNLIPVQ